MKKFNLEIIVLICGAVVMAFEIIGSRMLGPYVGTSMIVWSSIIGIILLSLSLGYYYGGRIADARPNYGILAGIIGIAGLFILVSMAVKKPLLDLLTTNMDNIHIISIISSLILFSVPAVALGMVSPFAARLKIRDKKTAGATVGYLYAISTLGSIAGTFLAGFYLIPGYRLTNILLFLAFVLIVVSLYTFLFQDKSSLFSKKVILTDEEH